MSFPRRVCFRQLGPLAGSPHHYFHFLIGYALPGIHTALRAQKRFGQKPVELLDCGPHLNDSLVALFNHAGLDVSGLQTLPHSPYRNFFRPGHLSCARWDSMLNQWVKGRSRQPKQVGPRLLEVRRTILRSVGVEELGVAPKNGPVLLLERSTPPAHFLNKDGSVRGTGYGSSRRFLPNLDVLEDGLRRAGVPVIRYEPGAHPIDHQIQTFNSANAVVGIQGAEFANVVWAEAGIKVCQVRTYPFSISWALTDIVGGYWCPVIHPEPNHPEIAVSDVLAALSGPPKRPSNLR